MSIYDKFMILFIEKCRNYVFRCRLPTSVTFFLNYLWTNTVCPLDIVHTMFDWKKCKSNVDIQWFDWKNMQKYFGHTMKCLDVKCLVEKFLKNNVDIQWNFKFFRFYFIKYRYINRSGIKCWSLSCNNLKIVIFGHTMFAPGGSAVINKK